jgi:hypothetical protein
MDLSCEHAVFYLQLDLLGRHTGQLRLDQVRVFGVHDVDGGVKPLAPVGWRGSEQGSEFALDEVVSKQIGQGSIQG